MKLKRIHHVAYRCQDARQTVEFYQRVLNMEFRRRPCAMRMGEHPQAKLQTVSGGTGGGFRSLAKIFLENCFNVLGQDPPTVQFRSIPRLWQKRMTAEGFTALDNTLFERQMLKGVKSVMMNECRDWPLRGQQVRRVFDPFTDGLSAQWASSLCRRPLRFPQPSSTVRTQFKQQMVYIPLDLLFLPFTQIAPRAKAEPFDLPTGHAVSSRASEWPIRANGRTPRPSSNTWSPTAGRLHSHFPDGRSQFVTVESDDSCQPIKQATCQLSRAGSEAVHLQQVEH